MNASGIRPYEGFYSYNSIKMSEIRNQQIAAAQSKHELPVEEVLEEDKSLDMSMSMEKRPLNQKDFNFADEYRPNAVYSLKGEESDIESLDIEQAVSDLEKDQVLQQYQYFVSDRALYAGKPNENMVVSHSGENFAL